MHPHRPNCPFASALIGSIGGSAAGAAVGAGSGWLAYAAYVSMGGRYAEGFALLAFGTLGMGVGGSGGAAGGMIGGWGLASAKAPTEASAARWGAGLGGAWGLQPALWLLLTADGPARWAGGFGIVGALIALGAIAGLVGGRVARPAARLVGVEAHPAAPIRKAGH